MVGDLAHHSVKDKPSKSLQSTTERRWNYEAYQSPTAEAGGAHRSLRVFLWHWRNRRQPQEPRLQEPRLQEPRLQVKCTRSVMKNSGRPPGVSGNLHAWWLH